MKKVNAMENKKRIPKSPFEVIDSLPNELKIVQKMLLSMNKNQHDAIEKQTTTNEALYLLNQQYFEIVKQIQITNYYLSILATYQGYMFDTHTIDQDAETLRNNVNDYFNELFHSDKETDVNNT